MEDENSADLWNNKGYALYKLGKNDEAITCYDKAIEIDPNSASAWNNKGNALDHTSNRGYESQKCHDRARELGYNPK